MKYTIAQIAQLLNAEIVGDASLEISTICKIEEGAPGGLTFLSNPKYTQYIYTTKATAAIVNKDFVPEQEVPCTLIKVENSYLAFAQLLNFYQEQQAAKAKTGISPLACIAESAQIGQNVYIAEFVSVGEHAVIGDGARLYPHVTVGDEARVGARTTLYANVTLYAQCVVGDDCILHAGSVIGADGFGFAPNTEGYEKIPQLGIVIIEDEVEIGANTCVDRSTMGQTIIHKGVKLDNLIQVAHNCEIGENTVMSAQAGMAGSTKIGAWCMVGGQAGFSGHIHVADKTMVGAQCGVIGNTKGNGETLIGSPAVNPKMYFKARALDAKLPDMYRQIAAMQREIDELKKTIAMEK